MNSISILFQLEVFIEQIPCGEGMRVASYNRRGISLSVFQYSIIILLMLQSMHDDYFCVNMCYRVYIVFVYARIQGVTNCRIYYGFDREEVRGTKFYE